MKIGEMKSQEDIDFYAFAISDLQALCMKNHITANTTNICMANMLASLKEVEGLDEILNRPESLEVKKRLTPVMTRSMTMTSTKKKTALEPEAEAEAETCSGQYEQIRILEGRLIDANEKFKMAVIELEEKDKIIHELQDRLASAETHLIEEEALQKKLHNTIVVSLL